MLHRRRRHLPDDLGAILVTAIDGVFTVPPVAASANGRAD